MWTKLMIEDCLRIEWDQQTGQKLENSEPELLFEKLLYDNIHVINFTGLHFRDSFSKTEGSVRRCI